MKFNKLDVPHQWQDYFTKYPHGYTIFEALCTWTNQVDNMVDNQNNWIKYLDNFVEHFEFELQEEVKETLTKWQNEGVLDVIIESALNTELDYVKDDLRKIEIGGLKVLLVGDIHYNTESYQGMTTDERMNFMVSNINKEYDMKKIDLVFFMGDVSSGQLSYPVKDFLIKYLPRIKCSSYVVHGNHDLISDDLWANMLGYNKDYYVEIGEVVFICVDAFKGEIDDSGLGFGNLYTPINTDFIESVLNVTDNKQVIILTHYYDQSKDVYFEEFVVNNERIKAVFQGHGHADSVYTFSDGTPVIMCGHFSYVQNEYDEPGWGYRRVYSSGNSIFTDKVLVEHTYPTFNRERSELFHLELFNIENKNVLTGVENRSVLDNNIGNKTSILSEGFLNVWFNRGRYSQNSAGGVINLTQEDVNVDSLWETAVYYVTKEKNNAPNTGYLFVVGYSANNFSQMFIRQGVYEYAIMVRYRSGGGVITEWDALIHEKDITDRLQRVEPYERRLVTGSVNGSRVTITGRIGGNFGNSYGDNKALKIPMDLSPTEMSYSSATFLTIYGLPQASGVVRATADGYLEFASDVEFEGDVVFNISYMI